jgi:2-polyprenyl-3-methyl-5-hydroxy-6-metoxy-1,4-benzoquinol methylase
MSIQKYFTLMLNPGEAVWKIRKRMPNVIANRARAISTQVVLKGHKSVKKTFPNNSTGLHCFEMEMLAHELFGNRPWMIPLLKRGRRWFAVPYISEEQRLDKAAAVMREDDLLKVARQAIHILFEIFLKGYAHCDFHAKNMYWIDGQLVITDFETMQYYSEGTRPAFPQSYDLRGECLESPFRTNRMCYTSKESDSLEQVLGISIEILLSEFVNDLKQNLRDTCKEFKTLRRRHTCRAERIYNSFRLPHFIVHQSEAQRDSSKRLNRFGLNTKIMKGRTVLDLGCNIGGVLFEAQKYQPAKCIGIEYDKEKVEIARQITAFSGLHNICFFTGDIEKLTVDEIGGAFDIVFCFAVEAHIKKKRRLFRTLGKVTKGTLYFEGNSSSDPEIIQKYLKDNGFKDVNFLGFSNDDCIADNNCRPLFLAHSY